MFHYGNAEYIYLTCIGMTVYYISPYLRQKYKKYIILEVHEFLSQQIIREKLFGLFSSGENVFDLRIG